MKFGWINVFGAVIVILMLIPNIVYAIKNKDEKNLCTNRLMNVIEQIGRYACIVLMWLPLLVWKFGFQSVFELLLYLFGNGAEIGYIEASSQYVHEEDAEEHAVANKVQVPGFYRIFTSEKNLDLLFVVALAFARSGATDDKGGSRKILFNAMKG